ncbi:4Fe-4S single cluster domain-containing protein [Dehalogenimonas formicexedens]|uniref:4Fe-4S single cluster domain-containing protein n=1 Tax=Dehalogenimonas formicexedens TaxID=1839801 RepID=A0A1P8F622_9CHLR|nr:radical SAM protein [Dehalogenimonas formicexedens]APV43937.1 4Fe-4S single cluster domain-containing protein [Dehalogenimonas formicexedens]
MLTGIHFLLTYRCSSACEHCFLFGSPDAEGTFTVAQLRAAFAQIAGVKSIDNVYFEGGEPFLYYPLLLEGLRLAKENRLKSGIVSNAYWATDPESAELWLKPLIDLGLGELALSHDSFHTPVGKQSPAEAAMAVADKLGLSAYTMCIEKPSVTVETKGRKKGEPIIGGGVRFRGRAAECVIGDLPRTDSKKFRECPDEDLANPSRVHLDSFGNVHLCQGLLMGNIWKTPLAELVKNYKGKAHPVAGPLIEGGPAELAARYGLELAAGHVDACHMCYEARKNLRGKLPEYLGPAGVYGESPA